MKTRLINFIKNKKLYFIVAIISTFIISTIYSLNDVTPFGKHSLLCVDFFHQYGPMLAELYDRIKGFDNLIYSFNMAMGLPFFRNFLNYLSSPFNIIMLFFSRNNLITSYSFIIGIKAVVSSITCLYFLNHKFKSKEVYFIPLSILYAFSAYFIAYYWNIMWLDGMVFLPLITAGIEKIINEGKYKLYLFSLAIMMFANYFIAYMICIYAVIYFIIYLFSTLKYKKSLIKENLKFICKRFLKFACSSLVAACLVSIFLIPMFSSMTSISATGGSIPTSQYYDFELFDFIKGHLSLAKSTVFASDDVTIPNVSCGILPVLLFILFIINRKIPIKTKICYLLCYAFFVLAFFYAPLDYILHAFHVPNDLPYRYSFLYIFTMIIISSISLKNIKHIKFYVITIIYVLLMLGLGFMTVHTWKALDNSSIYINMILLTLYFLLYAGCYFQEKLKLVFYVGLILVSSIDVIISIDYNWNITQVLENFYEDYKPTKELLNEVEKDNDELFYRIENTSMLTLNDASWYNYRGLSTFTSMAYESLANLHYKLGIPGNEINSYYYAQTTPIYDLMFDIKYFIGNSNDNKRYKDIKTIDETANKFLYNVGLMYGVNKDIKKWKYEDSNPFKIQNDYIKLATNIDNVLVKSSLVNQEEVYHDDEEIIIKYSYTNNFENMYFYADDPGINYIFIGTSIYYNNDAYNDVDEKVSDIVYTYEENYSEKKIINIVSLDDTIDIYVSYNIYNNDTLNVYELDNDQFIDAYNILNNNKVNITKYDEYKLSGEVSLKEDKTIYTSIPYDDGWHVYIDDKEVKTFKIGDSLLAFDCQLGKHSIKLKYKIPYLYISVPLTILGILIIVGETYISKKKIKDKKN